MKHIHNTWIEINQKASLQTKKLTQEIGFWTIICDDTTDEISYRALKNWCNWISFISNENLPPPYGCFYDDEASEPFFDNLYTIWRIFWQEVLDNCEIFPRKISAILDGRIHTIWPKYFDFSNEIVERRKSNPNLEIAPIWIQIWQRFFNNLWEVWKNYLLIGRNSGWIVMHLPHWINRWDRIIAYKSP